MNELPLLDLLLISFGVAMDAFTVSICKGLSFKKNSFKNSLIVALYFGTFQAAMPLAGYLLGVQFQDSLSRINHWLAFFLLVAIGINMIKESQNSCEDADPSLNLKTMIILGIARSIDAVPIGISLACLRINIIVSIIIIGLVTFVLSFLGAKIGNIFGTKFKSKAEAFGGLILILMATKILMQHLGFINF